MVQLQFQGAQGHVPGDVQLPITDFRTQLGAPWVPRDKGKCLKLSYWFYEKLLTDVI